VSWTSNRCGPTPRSWRADIKYPTDSGLLKAATCRNASRRRRLRNAGVKVSFIDRTSEARALQHSIGVWLRRRNDEATADVLVITGQVADSPRSGDRDDGSLALHGSPATRAGHARRSRSARRTHMPVIDQARARVQGDQRAGATRLVSLHEPDVRPIRKGRLGKPVEFGYKAQVVDNPDGLILDHSVHIGNPPTPNCCARRSHGSPPTTAPRHRWARPTAATGTRRSSPTSPLPA
jgi:transposase, IS5 family